MVYNKTVWEKGMVINADNLNAIENGISTALEQLSALTGESDVTSDQPINVNVGGNLTVGDSSNVNDKKTNLHTYTTNYGTLRVKGNTFLEGSVQFGDEQQNHHTIKMYGPLNIYHTLNVGSTTANQNTTLNGTLDVTGAATLQSTVDITGNTTVDGTLTAPNISGNTTINNGKFTATGNSEFGTGIENTQTNTTTYNNTAIFNANTTVNGTFIANNGITINADATIEGTLIAPNISGPTTISNGKLTVAGNSEFGTTRIDDQTNTAIYTNKAIFNANTIINGTLTAPTITGNSTTIEGTLIANKIVHNGNFTHATTTSDADSNVTGTTLTQPTGTFQGYFETIQLGSEATLNSPDGVHTYQNNNSSIITLKGARTNINTKSTSISGNTTFGGTTTFSDAVTITNATITNINNGFNILHSNSNDNTNILLSTSLDDNAFFISMKKDYIIDICSINLIPVAENLSDVGAQLTLSCPVNIQVSLDNDLISDGIIMSAIDDNETVYSLEKSGHLSLAYGLTCTYTDNNKIYEGNFYIDRGSSGDSPKMVLKESKGNTSRNILTHDFTTNLTIGDAQTNTTIAGKLIATENSEFGTNPTSGNNYSSTSTFKSNVIIHGITNINNSLTADGNLYHRGSSIHTSTMTHTGPTNTFIGNFQTINLGSRTQETINDVTTETLTTSSQITLDGVSTTILTQSTTIAGTAQLQNTLDVNGLTTLNGGLIATNTTINGTLTIGNTTLTEQNLIDLLALLS